MSSGAQTTLKLPILALTALIVFATATLWITYQVKVNIQGGANAGSGAVREMGNIKLGQAAPDFSVLDLSNQVVSLAGYRGHKVVLLDFWATWCGPCRMEMVSLQDLLDKFKARNFEILSVNQRETAAAAGQFIARKKYGFHVLLDSDGSMGDTYGVQGIPTLVLVDKAGMVEFIQVGYTENDKELEDKIRGLTAQ